MDVPKPAVDDRHTRLLQAAARAAQSVTSILDPDLLLQRTVDIICEEVGLRQAGVFMLDESQTQVTLRAAAGLADPGGARLDVDGPSLVGLAIRQQTAQLAQDRAVPGFPPAPAALALPLVIGDETIGALLVQSEERDFSPADALTLQIIADQLAIAIHNARLYRQIQDLIYQSVRRARLLEAASAVGGQVAAILELDELLPKTVDLICETYGFYYAGVFLLDETGGWAVLRAGHGEAGAAMLASGHRLAVDGQSMVGAAVRTRQARIALDVDRERTFFRNPHLPHTRSEMALPLMVGETVLGAVTVQSTEERAFSVDDVKTLQTMADYLAIAIHNAQAVQELEAANAELLRSKTFEAIATATGEAVHWVGNKAAPIPGSVARVREDLAHFVSMAHELLSEAPPALQEHKFARMLADAARVLAEQGFDPAQLQAALARQPLQRLRRLLSLDSTFEDLHIIQLGAATILNIKEDLVGPARQRQVEIIPLPELLRETLAGMAIPRDILQITIADDVPPVRADRRQLDRVLVNLIKNALEAMETAPEKRLTIQARPADEPGMVTIDVGDTGEGIPPEQIDKIWVPFYTTKGGRGGTGLGLPACLDIIRQSGGKIDVESRVGQGTTFTISLPAAR